MTTDPRGVVQGSLSALEKLEMKIPGFSGYKEKELRRQADRMLRDMLARQYQDQKNRIGEAQNALLGAGHISGMSKLETANLKLNLLIDHLMPRARGAFDHRVRRGEIGIRRIGDGEYGNVDGSGLHAVSW